MTEKYYKNMWGDPFKLIGEIKLEQVEGIDVWSDYLLFYKLLCLSTNRMVAVPEDNFNAYWTEIDKPSELCDINKNEI